MKFVAFIRNVMIGRKGLARELLLETFGRCGATNASSFLATGNVIFEVDATEADEIVSRVSQELLARIDLREPMFVRSLEALLALAATGPFNQAPTDDVYERCVTFLPLDAAWTDALPFRSKRGDFDVFAAAPHEVFSVTRVIGNRPGQPGKWIEERLGVPVTTRNWNTIERILSMHDSA